MEPKATYNLESDGFLALEVYECIDSLNILIICPMVLLLQIASMRKFCS